jgi:hypothetical protein
MVLTPQQRGDFQQLGFFHLGRIFDDAALAEIRREYDRCLEKPMRVAQEGGDAFDYGPLLQLQSPVLCAYASSPRLVEVAVELLGPDIRLYWDQAVYKPARTETDVPWHQDNGYVPVVPHEYLTFTVALDATTVDNGCLWIQPGSHQGRPAPHEDGCLLLPGLRGHGDRRARRAARGRRAVLLVAHDAPHRTESQRRPAALVGHPALPRRRPPRRDRRALRRPPPRRPSRPPPHPSIRERDFNLQALIASRS